MIPSTGPSSALVSHPTWSGGHSTLSFSGESSLTVIDCSKRDGSVKSSFEHFQVPEWEEENSFLLSEKYPEVEPGFLVRPQVYWSDTVEVYVRCRYGQFEGFWKVALS